MTKVEFFTALSNNLKDLPKIELREHINFYNEMIDDRMEEGLSEEEAVAMVGSVDDIAAQIRSDFVPVAKGSKREFKTWEIVFLVLGSPIWLSLLIAAAAVVFSLYIVIWALVVSLWAVFVSLICAGFTLVLSFIIGFIAGWNILNIVAVVGCGFVCIGLSIFMFFACKAITKGVVILSKNIALWIKKCFTKKEEL